jgi:hypothetical protein
VVFLPRRRVLFLHPLLVGDGLLLDELDVQRAAMQVVLVEDSFAGLAPAGSHQLAAGAPIRSPHRRPGSGSGTLPRWPITGIAGCCAGQDHAKIQAATSKYQIRKRRTAEWGQRRSRANGRRSDPPPVPPRNRARNSLQLSPPQMLRSRRSMSTALSLDQCSGRAIETYLDFVVALAHLSGVGLDRSRPASQGISPKNCT